MAAIWGFSPTYNDGYPYVMTAADLPEKSQEKPYPLYLWRRENGKNSGYPFFLLQPPVPPAPVLPVHQFAYITVYDMDTEKADFAGNGLAVLTPVSCEITEVLNGEYSLTMTHPMDPDGKWEFLREENIIKALGQLFTVKSVTWTHTGKNGGEVTLYAEHIFYQQADPWIFPFEGQFSSKSCLLVMTEAMSLAYHHLEPGQHIYGYECGSEWEWDEPYLFANQDGRTVVDVLIGSGGIIDVKGGELYRDNFYFSINETMENAEEHAFDIRIGRNLTGIRRTVDVSTFASYYRGYDQYGGWWAWAWKPQGFVRTQFPHHVIRSKNYSYNFDDYDQIYEQLFQDVTADWKKNCRPVISYEIDLADVRRNPDFQENAPDYRYRPGNTGLLFDERIGEPVTIKITETVTDAITGDVKRVTIGSHRSFTRAATYPAVLAIEGDPQGGQVPVRDSDGVFCYDADGVRILERIV